MKPTKKNVLAKMAEIERRVNRGIPLQIAVMQTNGQIAKVAWGAGGLFVLMAPEYARKLAADFATPAAAEAGADVIGADLIAAADEADMVNASQQGRQ